MVAVTLAALHGVLGVVVQFNNLNKSVYMLLYVCRLCMEPGDVCYTARVLSFHHMNTFDCVLYLTFNSDDALNKAKQITFFYGVSTRSMATAAPSIIAGM